MVSSWQLAVGCWLLAASIPTGSEGLGVPFSCFPTDRLDKVLKILKVLRFFYSSYEVPAFIGTFGEPQNLQNLQNPFMLVKSYQVTLPICLNISRRFIICAPLQHFSLLTSHF